jgi:hypothetical protein
MKVSTYRVKMACITYTIPILNMNITFSFFLMSMRKEYSAGSGNTKTMISCATNIPLAAYIKAL